MHNQEMSRRGFLKAAGLTVTLASLAACAPKPLPVPTQPAQPEQPAAASATQAPIPAPPQQVIIKTCDLVAEDTTGPGVFVRVLYEEFAELFPNIKVDHLPYPDVGVEKRKEYWLTAMGEGGYDIVRLQTNKWAWEFAALGKAMQLDEYIPLY